MIDYITTVCSVVSVCWYAGLVCWYAGMLCVGWQQ